MNTPFSRMLLAMYSQYLVSLIIIFPIPSVLASMYFHTGCEADLWYFQRPPIIPTSSFQFLRSLSKCRPYVTFHYSLPQFQADGLVFQTTA